MHTKDCGHQAHTADSYQHKQMHFRSCVTIGCVCVCVCDSVCKKPGGGIWPDSVRVCVCVGVCQSKTRTSSIRTNELPTVGIPADPTRASVCRV